MCPPPVDAMLTSSFTKLHVMLDPAIHRLDVLLVSHSVPDDEIVLVVSRLLYQ